MEITEDMVTDISRRFSVGAGTGGVDSVRLQHWCLRLGAAREELWLTVKDFSEWLANRRPLWASHWVLMNGRLISLDKKPGVRLLGVEETWRQLMYKCILWVFRK